MNSSKTVTQQPTVPWVPRIAHFNVATSPPNVLPLGNEAVSQDKDEGNIFLEKQIKINATAMKEIEQLRKERNEILQAAERKAKENSVLQIKYAQAVEKLNYLKKKMGKRENGENVDPNIKNNETAGDPNSGDTSTGNINGNVGDPISGDNNNGNINEAAVDTVLVGSASSVQA